MSVSCLILGCHQHQLKMQKGSQQTQPLSPFAKGTPIPVHKNVRFQLSTHAQTANCQELPSSRKPTRRWGTPSSIISFLYQGKTHLEKTGLMSQAAEICIETQQQVRLVLLPNQTGRGSVRCGFGPSEPDLHRTFRFSSANFQTCTEAGLGSNRVRRGSAKQKQKNNKKNKFNNKKQFSTKKKAGQQL